MGDDYNKYGFAALDQKEIVSFFTTPMKAGAYGIKGSRWYGEKSFSTKWHQKGLNLAFHSEKVDWRATAWDTVGFGLSVFGLGVATKWTKVAKGASYVGSTMSGLGAAKNLVVDQNLISTGLGIGGAMPYPLISVPCSTGSVLYDLSPGFYFGQ